MANTTGITDQQIIDTIKKMASSGERPSADKVGVRLGLSNKRRILPLIQSWKESGGTVNKGGKTLAEAATGVPEAVSAILAGSASALWSVAIAEAHKELEIERKELEEERQELEADRKQALAEIAAIEDKLNITSQQVSELQTKLAISLNTQIRLENEIKEERAARLEAERQAAVSVAAAEAKSAEAEKRVLAAEAIAHALTIHQKH